MRLFFKNTANYGAYGNTRALSVTLDGSNSVTVFGSGTSTASSDQIVNVQNFGGGAGQDSIIGDSNNNSLNGAGGDDLINGKAGSDTLTGGTGNDVFVFADNSTGNDTVTDFAAGIDKLQFDGMSGVPLTSSFTETDLDSWKATPGAFEEILNGSQTDTVIHIDANTSVKLLNMTVAQLHVGDFIVH